MTNNFKKPYEISLWEDKLVYDVRDLSEVTLTKENYKPGKYYSNIASSGNPVYQIDYNDFNENENRIYYELKPKEIIDALEAPPSIGEKQVIISYYKEQKICAIGSNFMDSPIRAVNSKLVTKINGENTLTFTLYFQYRNENNKLVYNPFIQYMTNERKIKLRIGEEEDPDVEWYDFVIKQIQEKSDTKAFTYTCKDRFVNELSKTGFDLVLDNELENNMGTVEELAETILEETDWRVQKGSEPLYQYVEEPLYRITLNGEITAYDMIENDEIEVPEGESIYAFYSQINDKKSELQFLYSSGEFERDDSLVINKKRHLNYLVYSVEYNENGLPRFASSCELSKTHRGMRLVRQIQSKYDSTIDKFVQVYKKRTSDGEYETEEGSTKDQLYYGFVESAYTSPNSVTNYVVNPSAFKSTTGWTALEYNTTATQTSESGSEGGAENTESTTNTAKAILSLTTYPEITTDFSAGTYQTFLKISGNGSGSRIMNSSIGSFRTNIGSIRKGDAYIIKMKYATSLTPNEEQQLVYADAIPTVRISEYSIVDGQYREWIEVESDTENESVSKEGASETAKVEFKYSFEEGIESSLNPDYDEENEELFEKYRGYVYGRLEFDKDLSENELQDWDRRFATFFEFGEESEIYIEDVQIFKEVIVNGKYYFPGGDFFAEVKNEYIYYKPNSTWKSIKDLIYSDKSDNPLPEYEPYYGEGNSAFTKVRSIAAKESNRFNLLQDLNEKFECWMKINVERNTDGSVQIDDDYRQKKSVSFRENINEKNWIGFKYGVNSKSIQRTIDSSAVITKLIVKNNANEFGPDGFCSISRATDNVMKENFLLNFDYLGRQRLIDLDQVTADLYQTVNGGLGYCVNLKNLNSERDADINLQSELLVDIDNFSSTYQAYKLSYEAAIEEREKIEDDIYKLVVPAAMREEIKSFEQLIDSKNEQAVILLEKWVGNEEYQKYTVDWAQCQTIEAQHGPIYEAAERNLKEVKDKYEAITQKLKQLTDKKKALDLKFYKKYSSFIQEGSWIKEDYADDNLYYLDALQVMHTSIQPKITYTFNVLDLSQLPGYENYKFKLGEITYIEDVEFFGWSLKDGVTPYREEIVVTEITRELDSPEKNSIKVQNYKTQFEDLFSRIAAATQQAEFHTGEYARAASVIEPNGTISLTALENSFANNSLRLQNAKDQSVIIDENGITSISLSNPNEMVRIVNGGIFMTTDGGQSWRTGVTGYGLNSTYMTAGQIDTDKFYIRSGTQPAFMWDKDGIKAFSYDSNNGYQLNKYVLFDQQGLSGNNDTHKVFALDWDSLKFNYRGNSEAVVLGKIGKAIVYRKVLDPETGKNYFQKLESGEYEEKEYTEGSEWTAYEKQEEDQYGFQINDSAGTTVLQTGNDGKLWLKDVLHVGENDQVKIGAQKKDEIHSISRPVFRAGKKDGSQDFIVYEDGYFVANGGKIGNMTIAQIAASAYEVVITSSKGLTMNGKINTTLTATLYAGKDSVTEGVTYRWYKINNNQETEVGDEQNLTITDGSFDNDGYAKYYCDIAITTD